MPSYRNESPYFCDMLLLNVVINENIPYETRPCVFVFGSASLCEINFTLRTKSDCFRWSCVTFINWNFCLCIRSSLKHSFNCNVYDVSPYSLIICWDWVFLKFLHYCLMLLSLLSSSSSSFESWSKPFLLDYPQWSYPKRLLVSHYYLPRFLCPAVLCLLHSLLLLVNSIFLYLLLSLSMVLLRYWSKLI